MDQPTKQQMPHKQINKQKLGELRKKRQNPYPLAMPIFSYEEMEGKLNTRL